MLDFLLRGAILTGLFYWNTKSTEKRTEERIARDIKDYCRDHEMNELRAKLGLPPKY